MQWNDWLQECSGKQVVLYGLGAGSGNFLSRIDERVTLVGVIDNDERKAGMLLGAYKAEAYQREIGKICIRNSTYITQYDKEETVFVVASAKRYTEIVQELQRNGFEQIYSIQDVGLALSDKDSLEQEQQRCAIAYCEEPIQQNKIIFYCYANYADHEKYISEALQQKNLELDLVWLVNDNQVQLPLGTRKVLKSNWKQVLHEVETAKMWIADVAVPMMWKKRTEQIYIQTKHWASVTLKKFYLDANTFDTEQDKLQHWKRESEIIDCIVIGSEFDRESCKRGFAFDKEFILAGSPRSDGLFRKENKEKVYRYYHLDEGVKVCMYAPTYRFSKEQGKSVHQSREIALAYDKLQKALEVRFGGKWMIALRLHPSVRLAVKDMQLSNDVIDVSDYEDSEELVAAFAVTISDYSSLMFEPAFVRKPVFLYATDLKDYLENEYELLIPYHQLPFDIAQNSDVLCDKIRNFDTLEYERRVESFFRQYGVDEDGHASERVAGIICAKLGG
ncbi:MAG: CDP-glycerol glycerophosphotransferase family protein [Lachnospiraceae bacterium]|nr:CDP-glycerol glycerophosphotransferase family protein [Lachnospiraceae bacterium]